MMRVGKLSRVMPRKISYRSAALRMVWTVWEPVLSVDVNQFLELRMVYWVSSLYPEHSGVSFHRLNGALKSLQIHEVGLGNMRTMTSTVGARARAVVRHLDLDTPLVCWRDKTREWNYLSSGSLRVLPLS